ncbi:unnamed protein product [Merluccius merluccius]
MERRAPGPAGGGGGGGQVRCGPPVGPPVGPLKTLRVKMVLVGNAGVGKSSLALRFSKDEFRSLSPTVGCAYLTQMVCLSDVRLCFEIWDTAGEERYHSITPLYYRGAHVAVVVYDISKRETFLRAQMWLMELEKQYVMRSTLLVLVGNKEDLHHIRQVTTQEGLSLAEDRGLLYMETSSMSGYQVNDLLQEIAHRVKSLVGGQPGLLADWESPLVELQRTTAYNPIRSCCPNLGP